MLIDGIEIENVTHMEENTNYPNSNEPPPPNSSSNNDNTNFESTKNENNKMRPHKNKSNNIFKELIDKIGIDRVKTCIKRNKSFDQKAQSKDLDPVLMIHEAKKLADSAIERYKKSIISQNKPSLRETELEQKPKKIVLANSNAKNKPSAAALLKKSIMDQKQMTEHSFSQQNDGSDSALISEIIHYFNSINYDPSSEQLLNRFQDSSNFAEDEFKLKKFKRFVRTVATFDRKSKCWVLNKEYRVNDT